MTGGLEAPGLGALIDELAGWCPPGGRTRWCIGAVGETLRAQARWFDAEGNEVPGQQTPESILEAHAQHLQHDRVQWARDGMGSWTWLELAVASDRRAQVLRDAQLCPAIDFTASDLDLEAARFPRTGEEQQHWMEVESRPLPAHFGSLELDGAWYKPVFLVGHCLWQGRKEGDREAWVRLEYDGAAADARVTVRALGEHGWEAREPAAEIRSAVLYMHEARRILGAQAHPLWDTLVVHLDDQANGTPRLLALGSL